VRNPKAAKPTGSWPYPNGDLAKWEYKVSPAKIVEAGPDGVAVAGGVVYGDTTTTVFALNTNSR
jgi:hypothetical protein